MDISTANAARQVGPNGISHEEIHLVQASYGRALWDLDFLDNFYEFFLGSHLEIGARFADTDYIKQKDLLRQVLMSVLMFAEGQSSARSCLERIRDTQSREKMGITPDLTPHWINSLMRAVAKSDPRFDESLEASWRTVIAPAIAFIKSGY